MKTNTLSVLSAVAAASFLSLALEAKELRVSILGDDDARPDAPAAEKSWWHRVLKDFNATLVANESWSGAAVTTLESSGEANPDRAVVSRLDKLGENPGVILVAAGYNDILSNPDMGDYKWSKWTKDDMKAFRPALGKTLATLQKRYPKAKVLYVVHPMLTDDMKASIRKAAKRYKARTVELKDIDVLEGHPTEKGMVAMAEQVSEALSKMGVKPGSPVAAPVAKKKTPPPAEATKPPHETGLAKAATPDAPHAKLAHPKAKKTAPKAAPKKLDLGLTVADSKTELPEAYYIPVRWNSLGTSITWYNSHAGGAFQKGYQSRVMEKLKFDGFENTGISGGCVNSAISQVRQADLYTVEHGINDWGNRVRPGTLDDYKNDAGNQTFAANYRKVINNIRAANPQAKIILCTPRKGYGFGGYLPDDCNAQQTNGGYYLKEYAALVREIAAYENFPLADFFATCGEQDELASLSIDVALHPNDAGYQRMANILARVILSVYPDATPLSQYKPAFTDDGTPKDLTVKKFLNSTEQVVLKGTPIEKVRLASAKIGGGWVPGGPFEGKVYFERRDPVAKTYTCQVQSVSPQDGCMRVIGVEFRQEFNGDVVARVLFNRYKFTCDEYGKDYSAAGSYDGACASAGSYSDQGYVIGEMNIHVN